MTLHRGQSRCRRLWPAGPAVCRTPGMMDRRPDQDTARTQSVGIGRGEGILTGGGGGEVGAVLRRRNITETLSCWCHFFCSVKGLHLITIMGSESRQVMHKRANSCILICGCMIEMVDRTSRYQSVRRCYYMLGQCSSTPPINILIHTVPRSICSCVSA